LTSNALEVKNLTSYVGKFALDDVNLELKQGTIMGFVGRNGAGKTTFIKTIMDIIPKQEGEVLFNGLPLFGNEGTVKARVGVVFDSHIYPPNLKAKKIRDLVAPFYPSFDNNKFDRLMKRLEMDPDKKLATYSKGMQMKFSIAMVLSCNPGLVIMDEPTAGLDPVARADILDLLMEMMQTENNSILLSTHITSDLEKIADYLTIIEEGRIILSLGKDEALDRFTLVQIDKDAMTENLRAELIGVKQTAFGYVGLGIRERLVQTPEVKFARPAIEDLLMYSRKGGRPLC